MLTTCSPILMEQSLDIILIASNDKEWLFRFIYLDMDDASDKTTVNRDPLW